MSENDKNFYEKLCLIGCLLEKNMKKKLKIPNKNLCKSFQITANIILCWFNDKKLMYLIYNLRNCKLFMTLAFQNTRTFEKKPRIENMKKREL